METYDDSRDKPMNVECILHIESGRRSNEKTLPFTDATWLKVQTAATARSDTWKTSKYDIVCRNLPDSFETRHGYHPSCYSKFTAVPKAQTPISAESRQESTDKLLRSDLQSQIAGTSGIFEKICFFRRQKTKSKGKSGVERVGSSEDQDAETNIKEAAKVLNDREMITKIGSIDFVAKEVKYHHSCRKTYLNRAERLKHQMVSTEEIQDSEYHKLRSSHDKAFCDISKYVQEVILDEERAELLTSLHERYMVYLAELGNSDSNYSAQSLGNKLMKHFQGKLSMGKSYKR